MLGIIYILICGLVGAVGCKLFMPWLGGLGAETYRGEKLRLSPVLYMAPAWYLVGTLLVTWSVYLLAVLLERFGVASPTFIANIAAGLFWLVGCAVACFFLWRRDKAAQAVREKGKRQMTCGELIFLLLLLFLAVTLMWRTFFIREGQTYVGLSVFSDFSPHLGMIRSFSNGGNIPTQYSHFAGEDIRYHFMFQFLVGNLELLGLRLDYAFNLPSIFNFIAAFSLLYVLAVKLSGKRAVGYLTCLFFAFRSSPSLFSFLAEQPKGTALQALEDNIEFIGYTTNESWGLWNLNVYCNQRHLAFGIAAMLLVLLLFLPRLFDMEARLAKAQEERRAATPKAGRFAQLFSTVECFINESFFRREGWLPASWGRAVVLGLLLGATAFWNGATLLAAIMVLFVLAIVSDRRLEFLITAVLTVGLSLLQTSSFIEGASMSPAYYFGFLAENKTVFGVADYCLRLCGVLLLVLLLAFLFVRGVDRWLMAAFAAPFVFAFFVSLTVDIAVNHKYIMVSIALLNYFAALLLCRLWEQRRIGLRFVCILTAFCLTATGLYDYTVVMKRNAPQNCLVFDNADPLTTWIRENATSDDIFLTSNYALNRVVMGGAMLYNGWQYFAWSAGYDTAARDWQVARMYEAASVEELAALVEENGIRYIIVEAANRESMDYLLKEKVIQEAYKPVYTEGDGFYRTTVYDTALPLQ